MRAAMRVRLGAALKAAASPSFVAPGSTATSSGSTLSIAAPANVAIGDVMLLFAVQRNSLTTPSGWTQIGAAVTLGGGFSAYMWAYYRVATAADAGATYTLTFAGATNGAALIGAYTGVNTTTPVNVSASKAPGSSSSTTSPTVTTTVPNCLIVTYFCDWENAGGTGTFTLTGGGVTQRVTTPAFTNANSAAGDAPLVTAGVSSAVTGTLSSGSGSMGAFTVALAGAA